SIACSGTRAPCCGWITAEASKCGSNRAECASNPPWMIARHATKARSSGKCLAPAKPQIGGQREWRPIQTRAAVHVDSRQASLGLHVRELEPAGVVRSKSQHGP